MQKRTGIIVVLLLLHLLVQSQQKLNFPEVDKTSYELFLKGNWKELIQYSEQARQQGIDFFYLQARTGIAFYNLKRYRAASEWFLKAWETDKSFEWLQEYLYYSLIFGGRTYEAWKVADRFTPAMQKNLGFAARKITGAGLEAGYSFNPTNDDLVDAPHGQQADAGSDYGEAFYLKNYHFESFGLSHRISPSINVIHNFTHIGINKTQRIDWINSNSFEAKIRQVQYYVNPNLLVGEKWHLAPSINLIWGDFYYANGVIRGNNPLFNDVTVYYRDFVFTVTTWSHFGIVSPGAEYNYGTINNEDIRQYSLWLTIYPFSNLSFYFTPRIYFKSDQENSIIYNTLGLSGGVQTGPVHLYLQYLNGKMKNFIESAGYVVSNLPGTSKHKLSGSFYFPVNKNYRFVLRYIVQDLTEKYQVYNNLLPGNTLDYSYTKHTVTAGISWNF